MSQWQVHLEFSGPLQRAMQTSELTVQGSGTCTISTVLAALLHSQPAAAASLGIAPETVASALPPGLLVLQNRVLLPLRPETIVQPGERLTLMPMISGG
jgi:sulfur carrier protein ThiS